MVKNKVQERFPRAVVENAHVGTVVKAQERQSSQGSALPFQIEYKD